MTQHYPLRSDRQVPSDSSIESDAQSPRSGMIASPDLSPHPRQRKTSSVRLLQMYRIQIQMRLPAPKFRTSTVIRSIPELAFEFWNVEVRQKGNNDESTPDNIATFLEDTFVPQQAAKVPTPTPAADEADTQDTINEDIDALLLGDQAHVASHLIVFPPILPSHMQTIRL
jgi:hypothetical protein